MKPNPANPLYNQTATTLPVDFHSCRCAFVSVLARTGVNVQTAMALTHHADPKVHMRYIAEELGRNVLDSALPSIPEIRANKPTVGVIPTVPHCLAVGSAPLDQCPHHSDHRPLEYSASMSVQAPEERP